MEIVGFGILKFDFDFNLALKKKMFFLLGLVSFANALPAHAQTNKKMWENQAGPTYFELK